jgi:hypothetical protein
MGLGVDVAHRKRGDIADLFINEEVSETDAQIVETLALDWLHLIDTGKFAESWGGISAELRPKHARSALRRRP